MQTDFEELRGKYPRRNGKKVRTPSNKPSTQRCRWKAFSDRAEILANEHGAEIVIAVHFPNRKSFSSKLKFYGKLGKILENSPETKKLENLFLAQCAQHEDNSFENIASETPTQASISSMRPATVARNNTAPSRISGTNCISAEHTVVIYNFGEVPIPFCSRIPGRDITLRQFKDFCITANGNFKFFFKTLLHLDDDSSMTVYQEFTDDSEILPLWEKKLVGIVRTVE